MAQTRPTNFSKDEIRLVEATLAAHFGDKIPVELADTVLPACSRRMKNTKRKKPVINNEFIFNIKDNPKGVI